MSVQRTRASHIDLIDTVIDKGIVVDAWMSLSLSGIDLIAVGTRVVVASKETRLQHAGASAGAARPPDTAPAKP